MVTNNIFFSIKVFNYEFEIPLGEYNFKIQNFVLLLEIIRFSKKLYLKIKNRNDVFNLNFDI